ncbi:MAG: Gfo/Idh/MocA family oxidoreductase [Kiritimatiellia bacterium]
MTTPSRRTFLKSAAVAGAALSLPASLRAQGANGDIRCAVVGFNSRGMSHIEDAITTPGVRLVALCDVDRAVLDRTVNDLQKPGKDGKARASGLKTHTDFRRILDDKDVDAIVFATPNHWHSLGTVWACQAGKDVYVEKPISHCVWEGRKAVEAARKYDRIVQSGTQNRSDTGFNAALKWIREGNIGKVNWVHGFWYGQRKSIGKVVGGCKIPATLDYDLWCGPAAKHEPLMRTNLHYDWHWFWETGNGDMGNWAIHSFDDARHATLVKGMPKSVFSVGGKFNRDDDAETPNTQWAFIDYEEMPMALEFRQLPLSKDRDTADHINGTRAGIVLHCEGGRFIGSRGGGRILDAQDKVIQKFPGDGGATHFENWIKAVRSRKPADLIADIEQGHLSSAVCHLANISYRCGADAGPDAAREKIKDEPQALGTFEKMVDHLKANGIDTGATPMRIGQFLEIDGEKESIKNLPAGHAALGLLKDSYRKGFEVPEKV